MVKPSPMQQKQSRERKASRRLGTKKRSGYYSIIPNIFFLFKNITKQSLSVNDFILANFMAFLMTTLIGFWCRCING